MAGFGLMALWLLWRLFQDAPAEDWALAATLLALSRADSPRLACLACLAAVLVFLTRGYVQHLY